MGHGTQPQTVIADLIRGVIAGLTRNLLSARNTL